MKARMHFDTLTYANKLKAAGMDPKLAEVQALALVEAMDDGVATKADIAELKAEISGLRVELHSEISGLRGELHSEMGSLKGKLESEVGGLRGEFNTKLATLKSELIQWMVGLFVTNITLVGAFIAFAQFLNHTH